MYDYEQVSTAAQYIKQRIKSRPEVAIICGTGLGSIVDRLSCPRILRYDDVPGFPNCEVIGNEGSFVFGQIGGKDVVVMQKRFHVFDGHELGLLSMPIRLVKMLGIETLFITTTAGGVNNLYKTGDIVLVSDHVDFSSFVGRNPLFGRNDSRFGARFPTMTGTYNERMRDIARKCAKEINISAAVHEGTYFHITGPAYETPATTRMLQCLGCDLVGMSITQEVIVAKHMRLNVLAMALITNPAVMNDETETMPNRDEENVIAKQNAPILEKLIEKIIQQI